MNTFYAEENKNFFDNLPDKRFRSCLVAAHLLTIELESKYEKNTFPNLDYNSLKTTNAIYKNRPLPGNVEKNFNRNIEFISSHLGDVMKKIKLREVLPLYLLVSYMRWNKALDGSKEEPLRECFLQLDSNLKKFSIYDQEPPKELDGEVFQRLMSYKAFSRQGLSGLSLKERLNIIKSEFRRITGTKI